MPTTDIGWEFLEPCLGLVPSIGIVGATAEVNSKAKKSFEAKGHNVLWSFNGFNELENAKSLNLEHPDCIIIGLGMPMELRYGLEISRIYPNSKILTCGGWLGFIAGTEIRAPLAFQRFGLEWMWRLFHDPARLSRRYRVGLISFLQMMVVNPSRGKH
jgi:N-acetylglucosaminyldiphosphoundecaprenol N-acetyl-beta-D-mannosaminyltransferase